MNNTLDQKWLLPQGVLELLPDQAEQLEAMRRDCIDLYHSWGYRLVSPPLVEYLEALLTGSDRELDLRTLKVTDQLSGRLMGIRADITPQVARMDAHALQAQTGQINRLCYVGSVLHAKPSDLLSPRTFVQTGVEIYGHAGFRSDREALELLIETCRLADPNVRLTINIGHLGLFEQMCDYFYAQATESISAVDKQAFLKALAGKSSASLASFAQTWGLSIAIKQKLMDWVNLQGGMDILDEPVAELMSCVNSKDAIQSLRQTLHPLAQQYPEVNWFLDFSEPLGYAYHTGLAYAAYAGSPVPLASGGRYDGLGAPFGSSRPATGFSADLLALAELKRKTMSDTDTQSIIIWAPVESDPARSELLDRKISLLRNAAYRVERALATNEQPNDGQPYLQFEQDAWVVFQKGKQYE